MIVLRGGLVHDPASGLNGTKGDIWFQDGRIIPPPEKPEEITEINAQGLIIAPGAIEIHSHIAGVQAALSARLRSQVFSPQPGLMLPPDEIASAYLSMGYTTLFEAAMPPLLAARAHADFHSMPVVDCGAFTLVSDQACIRAALAHRDNQELQQALAWLLYKTGGFAPKLVNPGIGTAWKSGLTIETVCDPTGPGGLTQAETIHRLATAAHALGLPHPVHLHAGNLGRPGSYLNLIETARALQGLPAHLCHIQFYTYARAETGPMRSAAGEVADAFAALPNLTCDLGQVIFGPAMVITADLQAVSWLQHSGKSAHAALLLEGEGGLGAFPLEYRSQDPVNAVQWAVGLELILRFPDPARLFLTTDYPNGGPFSAYPMILELLMDRSARRQALQRVHPAASTLTGLASLDRELTLSEVFAMTTSGPAAALGLADRGHLRPGARADIRCYRPQENLQAMFTTPAMVFKDGEMVVREGNILSSHAGRTLLVEPAREPAMEKTFTAMLKNETTVHPDTYGGQPVGETEVIPCR